MSAPVDEEFEPIDEDILCHRLRASIILGLRDLDKTELSQALDFICTYAKDEK